MFTTRCFGTASIKNASLIPSVFEQHYIHQERRNPQLLPLHLSSRELPLPHPTPSNSSLALSRLGIQNGDKIICFSVKYQPTQTKLRPICLGYHTLVHIRLDKSTGQTKSECSIAPITSYPKIIRVAINSRGRYVDFVVHLPPALTADTAWPKV